MGEIQEGTVMLMEKLVNKFIGRYPKIVQGQVKWALKSAYKEIRTLPTQELIETLLEMRSDIDKMLELK